MHNKSAEARLQTIRTLMERSALYRRALGPIMIWLGVVATGAAAIGWYQQINHPKQFVYYWLGVSVAAASGAFLMARRQAVKAEEPFWTAPAKRVVQAFLPPLVIGGILAVSGAGADFSGWFVRILPIIWAWCYGCALHSASFFMAQGVRSLGWAFIVLGFVDAWLSPQMETHKRMEFAHLTMGLCFGGLHLIAGAYLYWTERSPKTS
ncbi:MAG: hypothetical protein EXS23_03860 [Pedosphaera sp.]|nr:hypothetical protein [Pedosphaera sp.]